MLELIFTLLVLASAVAPQADADAGMSSAIEQLDQTITVTGRSLQATGEALNGCIARHCSPAEDIQATIAHAENQLIAGELQGARTTLLHSRMRNKRHARLLPAQVSQLLYFDAEVASLLGLSDYGRIGTIDSVSALKKGLSEDDPRVSAQRLLVGDVFLKEGRNETAVKIYDAVAERAAESGWPEIQAAAMFRSLTFYAMAASVEPAYRNQARRRYAALRATTNPAMRTARDASVTLELRLATLSKKSANIDALIRNFEGIRTASPMLVFMPAVDVASALVKSGVVISTITHDQWADFSFRITREGKVADVELTDSAQNVNQEWLNKVNNALVGRRYLPLDVPADSPGVWRRERFLIVADLVTPKGSRIRTHSGVPKLRSIDLTTRRRVKSDN